MPLLTAKKQLSALEEGTAGTTPAGLTNAANADQLAIDLAVSPEIELFTREFLRDSITALKGVVGKKAGTIGFKLEMKGSTLGTHAAGAPTWSKYLKGVGFKEVELSRIALTGAIVNGPFVHGEVVTFSGGAGGTAVVFMDTHDGATEMFLEKASITGVITAADTMAGDSSTATGTATASEADEGFAWRLVTVPIKTVDTTGALSAAPTAGDVLEGDASGARCIFVSQTASLFTFRALRGTFSAGEGIDNLTTPATGIGTIHGTPREQYIEGVPLSIRAYEDGVSVTLAGSRGTLALEFEVNRPVMMAYEYRGIFASADIVNIAAINYDYTTPPLWAGVALGLGANETAALDSVSDEQAPCLRSLNLDLGISLADRECSSAAGGFLEVWIGDRQGTFTMDPEATPEADIGWLTDLQAGTTQRLRIPVGTVDGNRFTIFSPGLQYETAPAGDRDGIMTREMGGKLTGGFHHNLVASPASVQSIGGDNEVVIIYHTS